MSLSVSILFFVLHKSQSSDCIGFLGGLFFFKKEHNKKFSYDPPYAKNILKKNTKITDPPQIFTHCFEFPKNKKKVFSESQEGGKDVENPNSFQKKKKKSNNR